MIEKIQYCNRGGLKGSKTNPSGTKRKVLNRNKPTRGKRKRPDSPFPAWAKELDEMGQFPYWIRSRTC